MNGDRHVIKRKFDPRVLGEMTCHDVASTIHQSLDGGGEDGAVR
jgi:hypothetical protein